MNNIRTFFSIVLLGYGVLYPISSQSLATDDPGHTTPKQIWADLSLYRAPSFEITNILEVSGVQSIFFEGLNYKGKPTKVYAYYGVPQGIQPTGGWPAVVLVHGGGGTAFPQYVKFWNDQGYAAISMDLEGHLPEPGKKSIERYSYEWSGPSRQGMWKDIDKPLEEQYFYHTIPQVVLAHSLIRSFPEVNAEKTGVLGVSWGGIITCLVSGMDDRFKFAVPVYGCGFLVGSDGNFGKELGKLSNEQLNKFLKLWEPSLWLVNAKLPMLWLNGTNDRHFPMDAWQKSIRSARGHCLQRAEIEMPHGSKWAFMNKEIVSFANSILKNHKPLPNIGKVKRTGQIVKVKVTGTTPIAKAELCYTLDTGNRTERLWATIPARLKNRTVTVSLPIKTVAYFINVTNEQGLIISSEYIETEIENI